MTLTLRPYTPADAAAIVALCNASCVDAHGEPAWEMTVEELAELDKDRPAHVRFARWLAEADGHLVGWGEYDQNAHRYHPRKFFLDVYVHPDHQGRGIGSRLYDHLVAELAPFDPLATRSGVREDFTRAIAFLQHRGWEEKSRIWQSVLDLSTVDLAAWAPALARVEAAGVALHTLEDLEGDPDRDTKLYDLVWEVRQDLPDLDAPNQEPFAEFVDRRLHNPFLAPGSFFIAARDGAYLGYIYHMQDQSDPGEIHIGQLGVARAWRGQGIAQALKVRGLAYACTRGYRQMRTGNESNNAPILHLNARLGFVRKPAWLQMVKTFGSLASGPSS